jgi:hypothetical protein
MELLAKIGILLLTLLPFIVRILWNVFEKESFKALTGPLNRFPR